MNYTKNTSSIQRSNESQVERFDLLILGRGTGSTTAAWTFAAEGRRVAIVDRKYIGGSCPNIACLPSENIIHSAKVATYFRRSDEFGIAYNGFTIDMSGVRERKRAMVRGLNEMYLENYKKTGAEFILGAPVRGSENGGSLPRRRNYPATARHERDRQYRHTGEAGRDSWSRRGTTAHAHRSTGTRYYS